MRIRETALLLASAGIVACARGEQLGTAEQDWGEDAVEVGGTGEDDGRAPADSGNGEGDARYCTPGAERGCYSGPTKTGGVGMCGAGYQVCLDDGSGYGPCEDEVTPVEERCGTEVDDDCDGQVNEGCACTPGATQACYGGPAGTEGVGVCTGGVQTCGEDGQWGDCEGQALPTAEDVNTPVDDDCSGDTHDSVCELHGILICPTNVCQPVASCNQIDCVFIWECID